MKVDEELRKFKLAWRFQAPTPVTAETKTTLQKKDKSIVKAARGRRILRTVTPVHEGRSSAHKPSMSG